MSSIPEALPTPRHAIRDAGTETKPLVRTDTAGELAVAAVVGWMLLALVGALADRVAPGYLPVNAIYVHPK